MRGDRPISSKKTHDSGSFTPHARGSTVHGTYRRSTVEVYPACAGIDPSSSLVLPIFNSLPRMRGDRPRSIAIVADHDMFTPHARGSTYNVNHEPNKVPVYPACAGIDPKSSLRCATLQRLPRMRGDRPSLVVIMGLGLKFTPHARGSTFIILPPTAPTRVYPACAGIDLGQAASWIVSTCLPRMRGDRPWSLSGTSWPSDSQRGGKPSYPPV